MRQTYRKLIGSVALLVMVAIYSLVATAIASAKLADASGWVHFFYFLITGLLWVLPGMAIVSWMLKPDRAKGK